jgi:hypothetical protein
MSSRLGLFRPAKHPVLSLNVQAETATPERERSQFEVLVRHLLYRFFHNELLASDDETRRVMQVSYVAALPTLLVSLFLYPAYHAFPPAPFPRPYWPQVGDHYFFVMYSFLVMGAATVYEWDLLFPDLLDVLVLSVLPISARRLFFARVLALAIFLALVLIGTSALGTLFFPAMTGRVDAGRQMLAHVIAVIMSGTFAATAFLALQGILLNTVGERVFRRITPVLQGGSIMLLLAVLLLFPTLSHSLQTLLSSGDATVRYFPPFWFLGIYEVLLDGAAAPPIFGELAHTGSNTLLCVIAITLLTYPLAYRRRVRQIIEGVGVVNARSSTVAPLRLLLHAAILRLPSQRAIFHFITETVIRSHRQRVMLALYGGLAIALALANMLILRIGAGGHVHPSLLPYGIRAAVPLVGFWTVIGLSSVITAPVDRRGSWLFGVLIGRPGPGHLAGTRMWIASWAILLSVATMLILHVFSPAALRTPLVTAGQLLIAVGVPILLADLRLYSVRAIPFTHLRKSSITDFPLMVVRYLIFFPLFITLVVHEESWIEAGPIHLAETIFFLMTAHVLLLKAHASSLRQSTLETPPDESDEFPQSLGLRDG